MNQRHEHALRHPVWTPTQAALAAFSFRPRPRFAATVWVTRGADGAPVWQSRVRISSGGMSTLPIKAWNDEQRLRATRIGWEAITGVGQGAPAVRETRGELVFEVPLTKDEAALVRPVSA